MYNTIYDYHTFFEDTNVDIRPKLNEGAKISIKNMKDIKNALKAGEYNNARRNLETIRRSIADIREDIERADDNSFGDNNYKNLNIWCIKWLKSLISYILSNPANNMNVPIDTVRSNIDSWSTPIENNGNLNVYKNTSLERINYLLSVIKMMDKTMEQLANTKGKRVKATATEVKKESFISTFVDEYITEDANSDLIQKYDEYKKIYKSNIKNIKKYMKEKNYSAAKKELKSLRGTIDPIRKDLYDVYADDRDDLIKSMFIPYIADWGELLIAMVLSIPTFGLSAWVYLIKTAVDFAAYDPRTYRQNPKDKNHTHTQNPIKQQVLVSVNKIDRVLGELEKEMDKRIKETPNSTVKESAAQDFKKAIYEACSHGLISLSDREELLEKSRVNMYVENAKSVSDFNKLSTDDKFKQVRKTLYEKCKSGEISIDERDEMILNARRKFF